LAKYLVASIATLLSFLILDVFWFAAVVTPLYYPLLQDFLRTEFLLLPGLIFYVVYTVALVVLAVRPNDPTQSLTRAAFLGLVLGLGAYGAYELTNLATLQDWPAIVTVVDMIWGGVLSALSAFAGSFALRLSFANHSH